MQQRICTNPYYHHAHFCWCLGDLLHCCFFVFYEAQYDMCEKDAKCRRHKNQSSSIVKEAQNLKPKSQALLRDYGQNYGENSLLDYCDIYCRQVPCRDPVFCQVADGEKCLPFQLESLEKQLKFALRPLRHLRLHFAKIFEA